MARLLSQQELARELGISTRHIRRLTEDGMPTRPLGRRTMYPWPEALQWYLEHLRASARNAMPAELEEARARKMTADAALAELELAKAQGQVVALDDMEKMLTAPLYRLRARLLAMPSKWAPQLVGCRSIPEVVARLEPAVAEAMEELATLGDDIDDAPIDDADQA